MDSAGFPPVTIPVILISAKSCMCYRISQVPLTQVCSFWFSDENSYLFNSLFLFERQADFIFFPHVLIHKIKPLRRVTASKKAQSLYQVRIINTSDVIIIPKPCFSFSRWTDRGYSFSGKLYSSTYKEFFSIFENGYFNSSVNLGGGQGIKRLILPFLIFTRFTQD